ncbi:MAG: iron ABC transporter permease [Pseudomonadota bacterium]
MNTSANRSAETWLIVGLSVATLVGLFVAVLLGSTALPADRIVAALIGAGTPGDAIVVWEIRLPRALAAMLVGLALGVSGAALQGLLRNPLAEPGVLGVSASASLGATVVIYYGLAASSAFAIPLAAAGAAILATLLLAATAARVQSVVTLILIGVGVSSFIGALMTLLMNLAPNPFSLADMINWMLGTVANRSFRDIALALPFMATGIGVLFFARRSLTALSLGEEAAYALGVNLRQARLTTIIGAGLATGGAVALAGAVGFVGIVAPHLVRPSVRHDPARTLLPAGMLGGVLLLVADIGVRVLPTSSELKLGVVAALAGAPVFAWIALRRRAGGFSS